MLPILELRGAIPLGIAVYNLSPQTAFFVSVLGNFTAALIILLVLPLIVDWLMAKSYFLNRFFTWLFERTRSKTIDKYIKYGYWALILFVAIPLPITGAWTGSVAAYIFNIPFKKSWWLILLGIIIAGLIMTFGTLGIKLII
jgi:uncharacterized membrane protein